MHRRAISLGFNIRTIKAVKMLIFYQIYDAFPEIFRDFYCNM